LAFHQQNRTAAAVLLSLNAMSQHMEQIQDYTGRN